MSLRVVHVVTSRGFAGVERHVLSLATGLRARGIDCLLACPPGAGRLRAEAAAAGVPVLPRRARARTWLPRLAVDVLRSRPDVVHVHDGVGALALTPVAALGGLRLVRTQHFAEPASATRRGPGRRLSLALHRLANARAEAWIAVSEGVARAAQERREVAADRVVVIAPGVAVPPAADVAAAAALRAGLPQPVVCFVGRIERDKHVELLVAAIPAVRRVVPGCRFVVAGAGSREGAVRARAAALGVADCVEWTGWVDDPAQVLRRAHVFANPCAVEGFGLAPLEAMAWALPVVAVRSSGAVALIDDGRTGLVVDGSPRALAEGIARLAGDRALSGRLGQAARAAVADRFSLAATLDAVAALYEGSR